MEVYRVGGKAVRIVPDMKIGKMRVTLNAPIVLGIVAMSFIATLLGYLTGGIVSRLLFTTYRSALWSPMTWIRAITHIIGGIIGGFLGYWFNIKKE